MGKIPYLYSNDFKKSLLSQKYDIMDDESEIYKSLSFVKKIHDYGFCEEDLLNTNWNESKADFVDGKSATIIWNSDFINQLEDNGINNNDIGIFPVPGTKDIRIYGDYSIGISKNTKNPQLAKDFLKYLFDDDRYAQAVHIMSCFKDNKDNIKMIAEIEKFNIPYIFEADILKNESEEDKNINNKYYLLKNKTGIDYKFVQKYIISDDTEKLRTEKNEEWKNNF